MGMSLSCLHYGRLYGRLLELFSNFVDFSSRNSDANRHVPILRALGSGKMLIERALSLKRVESDQDALVRMTSLDSHEFNLEEMSPEQTLPQPSSPKDEAAIKLQKVYKSFRTRRQLADCAVLVEQRWWKLLDFALLKRSSVSFFDHERPETAVHRWYRARMRAAKVGKGLSKDAKAQKLALQHWLEAIDPRHRYGHNLHFYYLNWLLCESKQPFFYWLDVGEGKEVNLPQCSRSKLQQQCIKYLGPKEREAYEVILEDGKLIYKQSGQLLDTSDGCQDLKWIFVLSTSKLLYVGQKKKGRFQHSSFLAGGATSSAGRLVVEKGILKAVWPHSGHYRPTKENFLEFMSFLRDNNVDLSNVKRSPTEDDEASLGRSSSSSRIRRMSSRQRSSKNLKPAVPDKVDDGKPVEMHQHHPYDGEDYLCMETEGSLMISDGPGECCSTETQPLYGGINALDIQHIFKGSEGETEEDSDDNAPCIESAEIRVFPYALNEVSCCSFTPEISKEGRDLAEGSLSSSIYIFQKKNLFEENLHESPDKHLPKDLLLQRIDSIKRTKSVQLAKQWTSGVGARIGCVRDYPLHIQFQALEQVNLSPRSVRSPLSACSTPPTTASSTPRAMGTSLLKHQRIDNCFWT